MADHEAELTRDELIALLRDARADLRRLQAAVEDELGWPVWKRDWAPLRRLVERD